jgi:tRNA pseudouridine13 synthase
MDPSDSSPLPTLTSSLAGTGGTVRFSPEDFVVEEIPLYEPCGEGQHVYVRFEKRGLSTPRLLDILARQLKVSPRAIGYAGMKDANAVTRQTISIDGIDPSQIDAVDIPGAEVLSVSRHRNKLKLGHLAGNRFQIRIRDVESGAEATASAVLAVLQQRGVPNYFGKQRFGVRTNTHLLGKALLQGDNHEFIRQYLGYPQSDEQPDVQQARALIDRGEYEAGLETWPGNLRAERRILAILVSSNGDEKRAAAAVDKQLRRLFFSAYQSFLFNQILAERIQSLDQLMQGDVAYIHANGAAFVVQDAATEQPRADDFEISPSGPLFGPKVLLASGIPGQMERQVLAESELALEDFRMPGINFKGARRPLRVPLRDISIKWDNGLMLEFRLPPGSYATEVLREVTKQ